MKTRFKLYCVIVILTANAANAQPNPHDKIVKFCESHSGEMVGSGECSDLATEALKYAAAIPHKNYKPSPGEGDYVWGTLVYTVEANSVTDVKNQKIQPGDILQLRDVRFEGKDLRGHKTYYATYAHHTAVVVGVEGDMLKVLEQNVGGKKIVVEAPYRLSDLKTGSVRVYRPIFR